MCHSVSQTRKAARARQRASGALTAPPRIGGAAEIRANQLVVSLIIEPATGHHVQLLVRHAHDAERAVSVVVTGAVLALGIVHLKHAQTFPAVVERGVRVPDDQRADVRRRAVAKSLPGATRAIDSSPNSVATNSVQECPTLKARCSNARRKRRLDFAN